VILLFHTKEPGQQFYGDGMDGGGTYYYSGEGAFDDMKWTAANRAVRDQAGLGRMMYLFERAQRRDGLWRLIAEVKCTGWMHATRPDRAGNSRTAIVFELTQ
jgi:hypothetical protein